jgi:hypothetical protein
VDYVISNPQYLEANGIVLLVCQAEVQCGQEVPVELKGEVEDMFRCGDGWLLLEMAEDRVPGLLVLCRYRDL